MKAERRSGAETWRQERLPTRPEAAEMAVSGRLCPDMVLEHLLDRIEGRAP